VNESNETRITKLEQHRTVADQKKEYCSCRCHQKTIFDFMEISDELVLEVVDILKSSEFQKKDGTRTNRLEDLQQRLADEKPCDCSH